MENGYNILEIKKPKLKGAKYVRSEERRVGKECRP